MQQALILTVLGMGTVFVVLYLIDLMIVLMSKLITWQEASGASKTANENLSAGNDEEDAVAAAIAGVIAYLSVQQTQQRPVYRYQIRTPVMQGVPATWLTVPNARNVAVSPQNFKPSLPAKPVYGLRQ